MGLDVYMYRYRDFGDAQERSKKFEEASAAAWSALVLELVGEARDLTHEELRGSIGEKIYSAHAAKCREIAKELGLIQRSTAAPNYRFAGQALQKDVREIRIPSGKYPDHMFKIGYLRSSYNASGINGVLRVMGIPDLYYIFRDGMDDEEYVFQPTWEACLDRAKEVLLLYREAHKTNPHRAEDISVGRNYPWTLTDPTLTAEDALQLFKTDSGATDVSGLKVAAYPLTSVPLLHSLAGEPLTTGAKVSQHHNQLVGMYEVGTLTETLAGITDFRVGGPLLWSIHLRAVVHGYRLLEKGTAQELLSWTVQEEAQAYQRMAQILGEHAAQQAQGQVERLPAHVAEVVQQGGLLVPTVYVLYDAPEGPAPDVNPGQHGSSSGRRTIYPQGLAVSGLYLHQATGFAHTGPRVSLVYRALDDDEGYTWYEQSLEICVEMCKWVLSRKDPEKYYLHWSS